MKRKVLVFMLLLSLNAKAENKKDTVIKIDPVVIDDYRTAKFIKFERAQRSQNVGSNIYVTLYDEKMKKIISYNQYVPIWIPDVELGGFIEYQLAAHFID
jgi:hypothetical protein